MFEGQEMRKNITFWGAKSKGIGAWNSKEKLTGDVGRSETEVSLVSQAKQLDLILKEM